VPGQLEADILKELENNRVDFFRSLFGRCMTNARHHEDPVVPSATTTSNKNRRRIRNGRVSWLAHFNLYLDWHEASGFANRVDVFREAGFHRIARLEVQILPKIFAVHIGDIGNTLVRYPDPSFGQQFP